MTDLDRLLDFAARSRLADGGFGYLGSDGRVLPERPVETWIVARMTHVFGLAQLLGRPGADDLVRHGLAALTDGPLHDGRNGGWFSATDDDTKAAYVHAFVVLAGSTATLAGVEGGRDLLGEALEVWQGRFWDDAAGMAVEEWDAGWTACSDYRGANANMHGVEASLAAADALEAGLIAISAVDGPEQLRKQALRTVERVVHGWAREGDWRLPEHFTADWTPLPEFNRDRPADPFRPYGVTIGHQFEWSRLALHVRAATPDPPSWLLEDATGLFDAAARRGWAADGHDGFPYTLDWNDRPVVAARMHWVLCEAIAAAEAFATVTEEQRYRALAERWRGHGEEFFLDAASGNWHHELTPDGEVGSGTWAGQPDAYHLAQMLLVEGRPVRGSVAASLR
jgi:mannose/cellobiose epimerase-like protein (N-acyl-D-glucosamine 2-epimerase family)